MLEPQELLGHIRMALGRDGDLAERKVVVSAGGTQEPLDPVRVLTNRSSGKMGYAVAEAARDRGADAIIVAAPTALPDPVGIGMVRIETAAEMQDALAHACKDADALIMAAAVADWRPTTASAQKIKKGASESWTVELTKNQDVVAGIERDGLVKVGFAAESEDLLANAQVKLVAKGLHLIVANDITAENSGFGADTNEVVLLDREGSAEELPLLTKYEVGHRILDRVVALLS